MAILTHDVAVRAYKTFVEVTAAQAALYGTVIPDPPGVKPAAAVSIGATILAVLWNLGIQWFVKNRGDRTGKLAAAIDKIVDARLGDEDPPTP